MLIGAGLLRQLQIDWPSVKDILCVQSESRRGLHVLRSICQGTDRLGKLVIISESVRNCSLIIRLFSTFR